MVNCIDLNPKGKTRDCWKHSIKAEGVVHRDLLKSANNLFLH